jgi:hypothetical protein
MTQDLQCFRGRPRPASGKSTKLPQRKLKPAASNTQLPERYGFREAKVGAAA